MCIKMLLDILKMCYNLFEEYQLDKILMNWIFKNKNLPCKKQTSKLFCKLKNIFENKKTKTILIVLFLVCVSLAPLAAEKCSANVLADVLIGKPLQGVAHLFALFLAGAVGILEYAVDPSAFSEIFNSTTVKDVWIMARDTFNMFFILVLLFSAFCTIFQIDKWNLKQVWLSVLINALLVNFSFPIARFFIDVSNVAMYYFLNNMFEATSKAASGKEIVATLAGYTELSKILIPEGFYKAPITFELAIIIFIFILAMSVLVLAILFVVRLVVLQLLVMFSPIGFVANIFPETRKFAGDWWKSLLNYAFFGPIMVFMLAISMKMMKVLGSSEVTKAIKTSAQADAPTSDSTVIVAMAKFAAPIVVLWIGMGISKKMGIAGADMVVGKAQGIIKGAGAWVAKAPWRATKWAANKTGIPGGIKQQWNNQMDKFKSAQQSREAKFAAMGPFGDRGAMEKDMKRRAEEYKKNFVSDNELKDKASRGDAAAMYRLAEDKKVDQDVYDNFVKNNKQPSITGALNSKIGQTRKDIVAVSNSNDAGKIADTISKQGFTGPNATLQAKQYIIKHEMGKMSAEDWNSQDWSAIHQDGNLDVLNATNDAFNKLKPLAKNEVRKRLSGNNAGALENMGLNL